MQAVFYIKLLNFNFLSKIKDLIYLFKYKFPKKIFIINKFYPNEL